MTTRIAITGLGSITGLGHNVSEYWEGLISGRSGISLIEQIDLTNFPTRIGGEVKNFEISQDLLTPRELSRYDRFTHFALHCAKEALHDSCEMKLPYEAHRVGSILGVGMGGFPEIERTSKAYFERGPRRVGPFFIPSVIPNMATGLMSIRFGLKGVNYSIASACASAGHALGAAADEIRLGRQDMMVTGGAESTICGLPFGGFSSMKALSKRNEEPQKASRPFDQDRDGFVMGEGSGVLILENWDKAQARGAKIYAELVGHGSSSDAFHITAPHSEGEGAAQCMMNAISDAGLSKEQITHINMHGTSTPLGDIAETKAIKKVFGDHAYKLQLNSTKSMTGHLLGAASGVESVATVLALKNQMVPPTINLENQDPECDLNYTPLKAKQLSFEYAMSNSFGFGGTNNCVVFKKA